MLAAIDRERGPGHEVRVFGGEERHTPGDVFGAAEPTHRNARNDLLEHVFRNGPHHFSINITGCDGVYCNAKPCALLRQGLGEAVDAGFRGGIIDLAVLSCLAIDRADVDDPPEFCRAHGAESDLAKIEARAEVRIHDGIPHVARHLGHDAVARDPGVVDQDFDRPVFLVDARDGLFAGFEIPSVELDGAYAGFGMEGFGRGIVARVAGNDFSPGRLQRRAYRRADAPAATGDQCDARHVHLPFWLVLACTHLSGRAKAAPEAGRWWPITAAHLRGRGTLDAAAGGLPHEGAFQPWHAMNGADAENPGGAHHGIGGAEQPIQSVGRYQHGDVIHPSRLLVACQQRRIARVAVRRLGGDEKIRQSDGIAQAEVEALAGDRVDAVCCVADQHQAFGHQRVHIHGGQGIQPAAADQPDRSQMGAQPPLNRGGVGSIVERHESRGGARVLGPDNGGQVLARLAWRHRQLGERPGRKEMFQRRIMMRQAVGDGADHAGLAVWPAGAAEPGGLALLTGAPFGGDDQARLETGAAGQADGNAIGAAFDGGLRRRMDGDAWQGVQACVQGDAKAACLDHPAERFAAQVGMIEMQEERGGLAAWLAVRDADLLDRPGGERQFVPHAGVLEEGAGAGGDGIGAAVEVRVLHGRQRRAVHDGNAEAACGQPARQRGTHRPGADYAYVVGHEIVLETTTAVI